MKILILSHFNQILGPIPFLYTPADVNHEVLNQISELINLTDKNRDFFIHIVKGFQSANCFFDIANPNARGGKEVCLISIILTETNINIDLARKLLKEFIGQVQKIDDVYKALYKDTLALPGAQEKYAELKNLFDEFLASIPIEKVIQNRRDARILLYGLAKVGKTTILKRLQNMKSPDTLPTTNVSISRVYFNNVSLMVYDVPGQLKFRSLWNPYLESQDALAYIFDIANKEKYEESALVLHDIANMDKLKDLPLVIFINKVDLIAPNMAEINNVLKIDLFKNRPVKIFKTSAINNQGLDEAFKWITTELANKYQYREPAQETTETGEGLIFSRWDEDSGLELLDIFPPDAFREPESIAMHCFSTAQFIYGGEKFTKQVSFVLPITHLKANAAIYFDFIEKNTVRGGKLPLCLIIVFKEEVSSVKIESLNAFVFEKFAEIKELYKEETRFQKNLKVIYDKIHDFRKKPLGETQKKLSNINKKVNEFLKKF